MYGGAKGGGKTEMLLYWLAEGVQYPNFSGLFLRRTLPQLTGSPTAPIERSFKFFKPLGGIYNASKKVWTFPNGAMILFGSCQHEKSKYDYDGRECHRICIDQVEQFTETQYQYLFSILRRTKGYPIPCGIRSSANPIGGVWVKRRFVTEEAIAALRGYTARDPSPPGMMFRATNGAIFMPSRIADNPSLEVNEYVNRLQSKLGAAMASRLANGDWSVVEGAIIDAENFRYYRLHGMTIVPLTAGMDPMQTKQGQPTVWPTERFATVDTAGTTKQKAAEKRGKPASHSVMAIWDYEAQRDHLYLRHVWRDQVGYVELVEQCRRLITEWKIQRLHIENAHFGPALADDLGRFHGGVGLQPAVIEGQRETRGESAKHERAIASGLLSRIADGLFFLPDIESVAGVSEWLPDYEAELIGWTGLPDDVADQIDVSSHAAHNCKRRSQSWGGVIRY